RASLPAAVHRAGDPAEEPVPDDRPRRRRPADEEGGRVGPWHASEPGNRHLRRARRRPGLDRGLPPAWPELRELLAVPRPGGASGGSARGAGRARLDPPGRAGYSGSGPQAATGVTLCATAQRA